MHTANLQYTITQPYRVKTEADYFFTYLWSNNIQMMNKGEIVQNEIAKMCSWVSKPEPRFIISNTYIQYTFCHLSSFKVDIRQISTC